MIDSSWLDSGKIFRKCTTFLCRAQPCSIKKYSTSFWQTFCQCPASLQIVALYWTKFFGETMAGFSVSVEPPSIFSFGPRSLLISRPSNRALSGFCVGLILSLGFRWEGHRSLFSDVREKTLLCFFHGLSRFLVSCFYLKYLLFCALLPFWILTSNVLECMVGRLRRIIIRTVAIPLY